MKEIIDKIFKEEGSAKERLAQAEKDAVKIISDAKTKASEKNAAALKDAGENAEREKMETEKNLLKEKQKRLEEIDKKITAYIKGLDVDKTAKEVFQMVIDKAH